MPHAKIIIRTKEDKEPGFPEMIPENTIEGLFGEFYGVAILEAGMTSGKSSLAFAFKTPNGKFCLVQTSVEIYNAIGVAIRSAEEMFKNKNL